MKCNFFTHFSFDSIQVDRMEHYH